MNFNAKDDFVNDYQAELQQELDAEHRLEDEQDHDLESSKDSLSKPTSMDFWDEQAFENERHGFVSAIDDYEEDL